ncbi:hypothetical protein [Aquitalea palustris]|uniref:hypothetical protein n=1 Tax=Aquitalea palustris TaxID=2480983 RepID=UPI001CF0B0AE|nr:hypothetical protein [Aquitalea palustris]
MAQGYTFSLEHLLCCSGNTTADLLYMEWFADEMVKQALAARQQLASLGNLVGWQSGDPVARAQSARAYLVALHDTADYVLEFYRNQSEVVALFQPAKDDIAGHIDWVKFHCNKVFEWIATPL